MELVLWLKDQVQGMDEDHFCKESKWLLKHFDMSMLPVSCYVKLVWRLIGKWWTHLSSAWRSALGYKLEMISCWGLLISGLKLFKFFCTDLIFARQLSLFWFCLAVILPWWNVGFQLAAILHFIHSPVHFIKCEDWSNSGDSIATSASSYYSCLEGTTYNLKAYLFRVRVTVYWMRNIWHLPTEFWFSMMGGRFFIPTVLWGFSFLILMVIVLSLCVSHRVSHHSLLV